MKRSVKNNLYSRKRSRKNKTRKMKYKSKKIKKMRYNKTKGKKTKDKKNRYSRKNKSLYGGSDEASLMEQNRLERLEKIRQKEIQQTIEYLEGQRQTDEYVDSSIQDLVTKGRELQSMQPEQPDLERTGQLETQQEESREAATKRGRRKAFIKKSLPSAIQLVFNLKKIFKNKEEIKDHLYLQEKLREGVIQKENFDAYMQRRGYTMAYIFPYIIEKSKVNLREDRDNVYIHINRFFLFIEGINQKFKLDGLREFNDISELDEASLAEYSDIGEQIIHLFSEKSRDERRRRRKKPKRKMRTKFGLLDPDFTKSPEYFDPVFSSEGLSGFSFPKDEEDALTREKTAAVPAAVPDEEEDDEGLVRTTTAFPATASAEEEDDEGLVRTTTAVPAAASAEDEENEEDIDEFMSKFDPAEVSKALGGKADANSVWKAALSRDPSTENSETKVTFGDNDERTMSPTYSIDSDVTIDF